MKDFEKRMREKWDALYEKELNRLRKEKRDPGYQEGWSILENDTYIKTLDDLAELLIYGYRTLDNVLSVLDEWERETDEEYGYKICVIRDRIKELMIENDWLITVADGFNHTVKVFDFSGTKSDLKTRLLKLVANYIFHTSETVIACPSSEKDIKCEGDNLQAYIEFAVEEYFITAIPKSNMEPLGQYYILEENSLLNKLTNKELREFLKFSDEEHEVFAIYENYSELGKEHIEGLCFDTFVKNAIDLEKIGRYLAENCDDYLPLSSGRILKVVPF